MMALNGLHASSLVLRRTIDICVERWNKCGSRMASKDFPFPQSSTPGSRRLRTRIGENMFSSTALGSSNSTWKKRHLREKNAAARHHKIDSSRYVTCRAATTPTRTDPSGDLLQFLDAAKQSNLIPLYKRILSDQLTPVLAYRSLVKETDPNSPSFLFEAVEQGKSSSHEGRFSSLGMQPAMEIIAKENKVTILNHDNSSREEKIVDDPMTEPEKLSSKWKPAKVDGLPETFCGGWVGYFSYDTMRYVEKENLPFKTAPENDRVLPDIHLGLYTDVIVFDHLYKVVYAVHWVQLDNFKTAEEAYHDGKLRLDQLVGSIQAKRPKLPTGILDLGIGNYWEPSQGSNMTKEEYQGKIMEAKEHILAGDIFEIVLSQRFERITNADPFDVYRALRVVNPSPYMIYLQARGSVTVGASHEILVRAQKDVTGDVKEGMSPWDVLRAALPVGTVSGAPKVRAMQLIDELEPTRRGPYSGGIGHISFTGDMDIALALRTMVFLNLGHNSSAIPCQLSDNGTTGCQDDCNGTTNCQNGTTCCQDDCNGTTNCQNGTTHCQDGHNGTTHSQNDHNCTIGYQNSPNPSAWLVYLQAGAGIVADSDPESEHQECINKASSMSQAIDLAEANFVDTAGL